MGQGGGQGATGSGNQKSNHCLSLSYVIVVASQAMPGNIAILKKKKKELILNFSDLEDV